ncbi:MAG: lytic transglycosylase domain-containing protein [Verrucomicrobiota bacterium]|nr:lytic transglycosylase domain-containing protein [Verrucomicrobiota bacterium]
MKSRQVYFWLALLFLAGGIWYWWHSRRGDHRYDKIIRAAAVRYEISPALIKAVVWRESRFHSTARGRAGEIGLMQIRSLAGKEWAQAEHVLSFKDDDLLDPVTNILVGSWYLKKLLKRYRQTNNPLSYALADYNAGRSNVLRWNRGNAATNSAMFMEQITFAGTKEYVQAVTRRYEFYKPEFSKRF